MTGSDALPPEVQQIATTLARVREAMARRRGAFLLVFLSTVIFVQLAAFFLPGKFAARAALLIQQPRASSRLLADPRDPTTVVTTGVTEEEVNSEVAVLTSREVLAATVEATGLDRANPPLFLRVLYAPVRAYDHLYARYHGVSYPGPQDRAVRALANAISVDRLKNANVLVVSYYASDPAVAEVVLRELLKHYLDWHLRVHGPSQAAPFFSTQVAILEDSLVRREDDLQALKRQMGVIDFESEREVQLQLDAKLREESAALSRRLAELNGTIAAHERALTAALPRSSLATTEGARAPLGGPLTDPRLDQLKAEALRLGFEQVRLEARYAEEFPLIEENRKKLAVVRKALEDEQLNVLQHSPTLFIVDQERARLSAERTGILRRRNVLDQQLATSRARLTELDEKAPEAARSERLIRSAEERYMVYLASGERARIESALNQSRLTNVSIVQEPAASSKPVRPKKLLVLVASLIGGLFAALLTCMWLELRGLGLVSALASIAPRNRAP